ncbi:hypothetical protein K466DRAFT_603660 [Polyporus arcularius HHB13444]|uniref:2OGFeDO JBP1/TET oxygenase domain-containing protein n=1 Tax=Polyporus arcularius HHB13444 TaxID=1314778 RepID=A0A5C3NZ02_9APHY|nr:hypothetical protein K466DRAFT_603660 [Polyporus arcularius HHB13444]
MQQANDYLARASGRARALLPEYRARARVHYDWDTAMESFSQLSGEDGDPNPLASELPTTAWQRLSREQQIVELSFGATRQAWKSVQRAKLPENTVRMENFRLVEAVAKNYHNGPKIVKTVPVEETRYTILRGGSPSTIRSADDFDIVVHLPGALRGKTLDDATEAIEEWGRAARPSPKGANDMTDCYKRCYDLVGRTRLATLWHPVGHKHDPPVVCADVRKTGESYEGAFKLFAELDLVNAFCTTALLAIDPLQYGLLRRVYDWRRERYKSQVAIAALDKYNLWEGREIMFNRWSNPHWDHNDPHYSWACIVYFGSFTEARMKFRQLNAEICLRRGDIVFLRGRDVLHEVADWGDGERHFMVYFTHESLWDGAGIESRATPA